MKIRLFVLALALGLVSTTGWSLDIHPVWEHTLLDGGAVLPILKNGPPDPRWDLSGSEDGPWWGASIHDQIDGFIRYDADRLMLGVRDNGIDETAAGFDADLAARFPDRSILWINPGDGAPMGVAIHIGFNPVPLSEEYINMNKGIMPDPPIEGWNAAGDGNRSAVTGTTEHAPEYMNFDVSDDGVIYLGYWYMIIRWDPDGQGGFTGPTIAYEHDYRNHGGTDRLGQWRFGDIEILGSGANTRAVLAGKTWRNGMQIRVFDVDATSNTWTIRGSYGDTKQGDFGTDGGCSEPVISQFGEEVLYNASANTGGGVKRFYWDGETYLQSPAEEFAGRDLAGADGYTHAQGARGSDVSARSDLSYVICAGVPSYNKQNNANEKDKPAWITAYSVVEDETLGQQVGEVVFGGTKERPPVESDELSAGGYGPWSMIMSQSKIYRQAGYEDGACEILFLNQIVGYGRYTIGNTSVNDWSVY